MLSQRDLILNGIIQIADTNSARITFLCISHSIIAYGLLFCLEKQKALTTDQFIHGQCPFLINDDIHSPLSKWNDNDQDMLEISLRDHIRNKEIRRRRK